MKKKLLALGLCALSAVALASCASKNAETNTSASTTPAEGESTSDKTTSKPLITNKEIIVGCNLSRKMNLVFDAAIKKALATYPDYTIKIEKSRDLEADSKFDIVIDETFYLADYKKAGRIVDLNEYINADSYLKSELKLLPGIKDESKSFNIKVDNSKYDDNATLALPLFKQTESLFFNATVLEEMNVLPPEDWDSLFSILDNLKNRYPNSTPLVIDNHSRLFNTLALQSGYDIFGGDKKFTFDHTKLTPILNKFKVAYDNGLIKFLEENQSVDTVVNKAKHAILGIGPTSAAQYFESSKEAMFGLMALPGTKDSSNKINRYSIASGISMMLLDSEYDNNEERKQVAFAFMKELLSTSLQSRLGVETIFSPVNLEAYLTDEYQNEMINGRFGLVQAANVVSSLDIKATKLVDNHVAALLSCSDVFKEVLASSDMESILKLRQESLNK